MNFYIGDGLEAEFTQQRVSNVLITLSLEPTEKI